jgi:hypothetical protein
MGGYLGNPGLLAVDPFQTSELSGTEFEQKVAEGREGARLVLSLANPCALRVKPVCVMGPAAPHPEA